MAWYPDLAPCDYFNRRCSSVLKAVGWLSATHEYVRGDLECLERERLQVLMTHPWNPLLFKGDHVCEFCARYRCNGNLWIPGQKVVFVAPDAIMHYVERHKYLPPRQFLDAVMDCPEMGSEPYFTALVAAGGREFANMMRL